MRLPRFLFLLLLAVYIILATKGFNYTGWSLSSAGYILAFLSIVFAIISALNITNLSAWQMPLSHIILLLMLIPLLSVFLGQNDSMYDEFFNQYLPLLVFFIYYVFAIQGITEADLIKVFTILGLIVFIIQGVQILYPQQAIFGIYDEDVASYRNEIAEIRNGLYRYNLPTYFITLFCLYYYWGQLVQRFSLKKFLLFSIFLVSMYFYLTRQILFATIVTLGLSFVFINNKKTKWVTLLVSIILFIALFSFSDLIFGEIFNMTIDELDSSNIRVLAMDFYYNKIIESPIGFFAGHGHPDELTYWREILSYYPSDIGFVGETFYYGIFWFVLYVYTLFVLLVKHNTSIPLYIQLFVFGTMLNSIMIFPYRSGAEYVVWASVLYISSMYIEGHKKQ